MLDSLANSKLAVVIVNWNGESYIGECLNSIRNAKIAEGLETIVVDNGSSDNSIDFIRDNFPEVRVICNARNIGFGRANNIGIELSRSRYICLVNSDVRLMDGCLEALVRCMDDHPEIAILGPRILNADRTLQESYRSFPTLLSLALDALFLNYKRWNRKIINELKDVDAISGCMMMIRRDSTSNVGFFDERFFFYGEDIDLCKTYKKAGRKVCYYPGAEAIHYGGKSSSGDPIKFYVQLMRAKRQYWRKHYGKWEFALFICISIIHQLVRLVFHSLCYVVCLSSRPLNRQKRKRSFVAIQWFLHDRRMMDDVL